jgi:hypothetical protein
MDLMIEDIARRAVQRLRLRIERPDEPLIRLMVAPKIVRPEALEALRSGVPADPYGSG